MSITFETIQEDFYEEKNFYTKEEMSTFYYYKAQIPSQIKIRIIYYSLAL